MIKSVIKVGCILGFGVLFSVTKVRANDVGIKIVGGVEAKVGEFPSIVSIQSGTGAHFCGGSLIKKNWVLTAGHCASSSKNATIVIGLHDQKNPGKAEKIKVKQVIRHPKYNSSTMINDFALIELAQDSAYEPIELNSIEIEIPDTASGQIMTTTAGWGTLSEGSSSVARLLQKVDVPLINEKACNTMYVSKVFESMICAGYPDGKKDSCQGDSGGPLLMKTATGKQLLVGVVSWGEGCARPGLPGVYAKVNSGLAWIVATAK